MTEHAWFKLLLRGIGVLLLGLGGPSVISQVGAIVQIVIGGDLSYLNEYAWMYGGMLVGNVAQAGIGVYLLFGGGWIINRCLAELQHNCVSCGYDISASVGDACSECGAPILRSSAHQAPKPPAPPQPNPNP